MNSGLATDGCLFAYHIQMTVELLSSQTSVDSPTPHQSLRLSLHPDFELALSTTSLLGSRAKLQDLPKIEQLVASRLRQALVDRVVWPCFWAIGLPGLGRGVSKHAGSAVPEAPLDDFTVDDDLGAGIVPPPAAAAAPETPTAGVASLRHRRPTEPVLKETGLGGGLRMMPGGSDWGVGGM